MDEYEPKQLKILEINMILHDKFPVEDKLVFCFWRLRTILKYWTKRYLCEFCSISFLNAYNKKAKKMQLEDIGTEKVYSIIIIIFGIKINRL